jgi:hypothetical protein
MATGRKHIDNYFTPGGIIGTLGSGGRLRTHVEDDDGRPVYLERGDESCADCGGLIDGDAFGRAPYGRVLGTMKKELGETFCPACHTSRDRRDRGIPSVATDSERRAGAEESVEVVEKQ